MENMLSDSVTYERLNSHDEDTIMKTIAKYAQKYSRCFTRKERDYITKFVNKDSNFYGTPKIHKNEQIRCAIDDQKSAFITLPPPDNLEFRPIVAGCQSATSKLSHIMDEILKPLTSNISSYIKDTRHFLQYLDRQTPEIDDILVTFDIKSLYTNLKHNLVKTAIAYWLTETDTVDNRFTVNMILEGIDIIIKNNTFKFNGNWYKMKVGIGMGNRAGCTIACLTVAYLEEKMYAQIRIQFDELTSELIKSALKRFIDDCFLLWKKQYGDINLLHGLLNSMDDKIQYTMETSETQIPFLDVLVIKQGCEIQTDIFYKKTDSKNYLNFNSNHPRGTRNNIPFNLATRIQTLVSEPHTRETRFAELRLILNEKGYPEQVITKGIDKAKQLERRDLIHNTKERETGDSIVFISTFNPNNPQLTNTLKDTFISMQNTDSLKNCFQNKKLLCAKRKAPNIKEIVTRAAFNDKHDIYGIKRCKANCVTCQHLVETGEIKFNNRETFKLKSNFSCNSKYVIYLIKCECQLSYIGECIDLKKRLFLHRSNVKNERNRILPVSKHIYSCSGGKFSLYPFYQMNSENEIDRKAKEAYFINKYKPELNN